MKYRDQYEKSVKDGKAEQVTTDIHSWTEEGDSIVGKVLDIQPFTGGKFESEANQYIIETDDGVVSCVLGTATDKQLTDLDIKGKVVYIEFRGKVHLEDGRSVNKFNVVIC